MSTAYQQLEALFTQQYHLHHLGNIASWDEAVMMPRGGGHARSDALSTLHGIQHQLLTSRQAQDNLAEALQDDTLNDWQQANLRLINKIITNASLLPNKLVKAMTKAAMTSEQRWRTQRAQNDWAGFMPLLQNTFNLVLEAAQCRAEYWNKTPYNVLLDDYNPDFDQIKIDRVFQPLEQQLPSLIQEIIEHQQKLTYQKPQGPFPIDKQHSLGLAVMKTLCFDFQHGRLDTAHHPFCGGSPEDIRVTTRYDENDFLSSLMAVCHETGHAKYEQNLPQEWRSQPVGHAMGMALHESQSLLVEMQICRSKEFIRCITPLLNPQWRQQEAMNTHNLFALATRVQPSLIRVEADEVTYPMHVILRYQIERDLFNQRIEIKDLPDYWNQHMQQYLGIGTAGDYNNGVMQDVHWPSGAFGYFPAYTLGRLIAAQLFHTMEDAIPHIHSNIQQGKLDELFSWLKTHVHSQGQLHNTDTLLKNITGESLTPNYFINHIKKRYLQ